MSELYLLPGLGADRRIFGRLDLAPHRVHFLEWPVMPENSTLNDYARALASQVDDGTPHTLVGMSMGGMVAQEMASITRSMRTVIVSSWKGPQEMPPPIKLIRNSHPERVLTEEFMERMEPFLRWQMGAEEADSSRLLHDLLGAHSVEQLKVQINACLRWEGPEQAVQQRVHIHGTEDHLMPLRYIADPIVVHGGGHFMVFTHAEAVSKAILGSLSDGRTVADRR